MAREAGYEIYKTQNIANFFCFIKYLLVNKQPNLESLHEILGISAKDTMIKLVNDHHVWPGYWERLIISYVNWKVSVLSGKRRSKKKQIREFEKLLNELMHNSSNELNTRKKVLMPAHCYFNLLGFNRLSPDEIIYIFSSLFTDDDYIVNHYYQINNRYQFQWVSKKKYLINFLLCIVKEKIENNFEYADNKVQILQSLEKSVQKIHKDVNNGNGKPMKEIISLMSVNQLGFNIEAVDIVSYLEKYFFPDDYSRYKKIWNLASFWYLYT